MVNLDNAREMPSELFVSGGGGKVFRLSAWCILSLMTAYVLNNYLTYWQAFPGASVALGFDGEGQGYFLSLLQVGIYLALLAVSAFYVFRSGDISLRQDSARIDSINSYLIRAMFFAVLLVGFTDAVISFVRVEGLLSALVGDDLANSLGKANFRGPYVHMPLIAVAFVIAAFTRTLGFTWLALLVVGAELAIVIGRFVFSYEQSFFGDLVRFWYAALFLFASAYTLKEEGHVRVDIFYASLSPKAKGYVNAVGSVVLGIALCTVILVVGMGGKQNIINSPILSYETTQASFGLYVKYLMAGFLGVFAVTMMVQFVSYFLDAVADIRGEPGGRDHENHAVQ